jgi:hypothetical protein
MKHLLAGLVAVMMLLSALGAEAQEAPKERSGNMTVFDFEEDVVTVSALKPDVDFVGLVQQEQWASLIRLRPHFVDEIVRSAEDL